MLQKSRTQRAHAGERAVTPFSGIRPPNAWISASRHRQALIGMTGAIHKQVEDRSVRCGHENPSGRCLPSVWIIQPRIDSVIEVVELLVNVMGKNCKKNQSGFLSQRSLRTQGKGSRFKRPDVRCQRSEVRCQRSEKASGFRIKSGMTQHTSGFRIGVRNDGEYLTHRRGG